MKNLAGMMKQVQELQNRAAEMQAKMEQVEVEGTSGAGLVGVTLNGKGVMTGLKLDPSLINADEVEILEDLIVAAHADAKSKLETMIQDKMKELTGGLPLPPGLKLF